MTAAKISKERIGEIAMMFAQRIVLERRITIDSDTVEGLVNEAAELGISREEALQFGEELVRGLVSSVFASRRNSQGGADPKPPEGGGGGPPPSDDDIPF